MMIQPKYTILSALVIIHSIGSACIANTLDQEFDGILNEHYKAFHALEYFSAIQSSIQIGDSSVKTYTIGTIGREKDSTPIDTLSLFDIGSITKSFTAVLMLKAESDNKIALSQRLGQYFPEYTAWAGISLTQLLDMTSGLPNYSDSPTVNYLLIRNKHRVWGNRELINLAYPPKSLPFPPLKPGYFYTNTGYILCQMILEQQYKTSFKKLIETSILKPYGLKNTYYSLPEYPPEVKKRLVRGYSFNNYDNPELTGQDMSDNNLSWAGAAGALVANSEDVVRWVRMLFVENKLLDPDQKTKLTKLISQNTGKPIDQTTPEDRGGFGLGVVQGYDPALGRFWFYQGETLGFRALYVYIPCNQIIISTLFNSAVDSSNNHAKNLILKLYHAILNKHKQYNCRS